MKFIQTTILVIAVLLFSQNSYSQAERDGSWCGTDQYMEEQYRQNPALIQQNELFEQYILDNREAIKKSMNDKKVITFIIPVVWHVISYNGSGNVSRSDIDSQMVTLNEDFQRLNADAINTRSQFLPYAADIQVEFRLAHKDPNGNCTDGIVRIESPLAVKADNQIKSVNSWDSKKYFNIWTVISMAGDNPPSIILGYAQFPSSGINSTYGVVMRHNYISRTDRTLTHEVGHCFGLYHTFQGGCGGFSCSSSGDRCCDTPPVDHSTQGCNALQNSCSTDANGPDPWGGIDMEDQIENYMSYDGCQNMFTDDQKIRMYSYLNSTNTNTGLNQLTTAANLAFTGTADPYNPVICTPIADFSADKKYICEGDSVTFTDVSYNAIPTSWNWSFVGGTPTSSSNSTPTITYGTAGTYDVMHRPSTVAGTDSVLKTQLIMVSSLTADYIGPITDGFENSTQFNNEWIVEGGQDSYNWEITSAAAATGSQSLMINNFSVVPGVTQYDYIISPSYDLSAATNKKVSFKVAYARRGSSNFDRLMVYYSTDCGKTWFLKYPVTVINLGSAPDNPNPYTPNPNQWSEKSMNFTATNGLSNIRFKFEFESGGGNNIYLDDINVGGLFVDVDDVYENIGSFNVYPNPTISSAQITFNLLKGVKNLSVHVRNSVGQKVVNVIDGHEFSAGEYTLKIDEERKLSSGIYFVEFNADDNVKVLKLVVQ